MQAERLHNDTAQGQLHIHWPGGRKQILSHRELRLACRCAFCRSRQLRAEEIPLAPDLHITAVQAQGYGVQLVFSDGHDRGIFPWSYLAGLGGNESLRA